MPDREKDRDDILDLESAIVTEDTILNPQLYLHIAILHAIRAPTFGLRYGNFIDSLIERILMVDQAEKIAMALGLIKDGEDSEYIKAVEEYKKELEEKEGKTRDNKSEREKILFDNKIASFKLQKIIEKISEGSAKWGEPVI